MTDRDPDLVRALTERLGRELHAALPDGAAAIVLDFSQVGRGGGGHAWGYTSEGDRLRAEPGMQIYRTARELRSAMYRSGSGTWFSAKITVTAEGSMNADYNYDDEPVWGEGIPDHWFVTDLEKFPRNVDAQPEWLRRKVAAGA